MAHEITVEQFQKVIAWAGKRDLKLNGRGKALKPTHVEPPEIKAVDAPRESPRDTYNFSLVHPAENPRGIRVRVHGEVSGITEFDVSPTEVDDLLTSIDLDPDSLPSGLGGGADSPPIAPDIPYERSKSKGKKGKS